MEGRKPILDHSYKLALLRGLLHLIPTSISVGLMALNLRGVRIGQTLGNDIWPTTYTLAALQVAAKLQELLITASLTTVVFHILRHQLLHGDGLPLVLVGSGFTFTKLLQLPQWCTRSVLTGPPGSSARLLRILIVAGITCMSLVTVVVGPASAVLLQPRLHEWPVWAPDFWLNGTSDNLWPTNLTSSHTGALNVNTTCGGPRCISQAYQKLQMVLDSAPYIYHTDWSYISREESFERQVNIAEGGFGSGFPETWTYAPHAATGYLQEELWWDYTWFLNPKYDGMGGRNSSVQTKSPAVRTVCISQNITVDTREIEFPALSAFEIYQYDSKTKIEVSATLWTNDGKTFIDPNRVKTVWIPQADAQKIGTVTTDARWVDSNSTQADGGQDIAITPVILNTGQEPNGLSGYTFLPVNGSWSTITATDAWIEALLPDVPYLTSELTLSQPATTLDSLLESTNHSSFVNTTAWPDGYLSRPYIFREFVISTLFADGIARIGYTQQFLGGKIYVSPSDNTTQNGCKPNPGSGEPNRPQICGGPPPAPVNFTKLKMYSSFQSVYAWRATATTDYLSIAVQLVYISIALSHLLYSVIRGRCSSAWERLEDLLALAHSSRPDPAALEKTCAGIDRAETRAQNMRIVVVGGRGKKADAGEGDHLVEGSRQELEREEEEVQMVFAGAGAPLGRVKGGEKYGKNGKMV